MNKSETIKELAGALAKAQAEMQPAPMTSKNPFLNNRYADLGSIIQTARPVLAKYGLAISQLVTGTDTIGVTTILMHSSGEWIESTVSMPTGEERGKSQAQVAGSIITYLRRYSLAAVLGMYADEDADGNAPQKQPVEPPVSAPAEKAPAAEKPESVTNADVTDDEPYEYPGKGAKLGGRNGHNYPAQWVKMIMAYRRANEFECDHILQRLRPEWDTAPEKIIEMLNKYLDEKPQAQ